MNFSKIFQSKFFKGCLAGLAIFLVLLAVFKLGTLVGSHKADFSCGWGDNYRNNFGEKDRGLIPGLNDRDLFGGHGIIGEIIKIDNNSLVINGPDNIEKIILIKEDTIIKSQRDNIKLSDLKDKDMVTIVGSPDSQGQIEAKLIRVIPEPPFPLNLLPKPKPQTPDKQPKRDQDDFDVTKPAVNNNSY